MRFDCNWSLAEMGQACGSDLRGISYRLKMCDAKMQLFPVPRVSLSFL